MKKNDFGHQICIYNFQGKDPGPPFPGTYSPPPNLNTGYIRTRIDRTQLQNKHSPRTADDFDELNMRFFYGG